LEKEELFMPWSSVGSAGIVNIPDINKVVFDGAIVQLIGEGTGGTEKARAGERLPPPPKISAVLRYPVSQADLGGSPVGEVDMTVRYRDGAGTVFVELIQVSFSTGEETRLISLDSTTYNRQNDFHVELSQIISFPTLDFTSHAYYVALTLTGPGGPEVTTPPAVDIMQIGPASNI
jgi:hypothetical protein